MTRSGLVYNMFYECISIRGLYRNSQRAVGPGIESQWGRDFPHPSRPALRPTQPPVRLVKEHLPGSEASGTCRWTPSAETRENLHFYPPLLCSIGMLQRELRLRCCISVVVINIYTCWTDRPNADLKIESTPWLHRKTNSNRGRFDTLQWMMHFYFIQVLGDALHFLEASQVPHFSSFSSFWNNILLSSGLWFHVISFEDISILEGHVTSNFRVVFRHWGRKQHYSLKRWYLLVTLHGVISQNTIIWMNTAIKTSYPTVYSV